MIREIRENFTGRMCTILTHPVSFSFTDAIQHSQYFSGKVELVDDHGIWLRNVHYNTISFYAFPIIGIVEEQVVSKDDPRVEKIKEEMKAKEMKKKDRQSKTVLPNSQFIPIDSLTKAIKG